MPLLITLLVIGTIAQRYMGLYDAQKMFFSSFIIWAGPIPFPGGYSLISIITAGLLSKFIFKSKWTWKKVGINLSHLGVLIILLGGLLTAIYSEEGYIVIPEGEESRFVSDFHQRSLLVIKDENVIAHIPHQKLFEDNKIEIANIPFTISVQNACRNCKIIKREDSKVEIKGELSGMAQFMALTPDKLKAEEETNLYGATLNINDETHIVFEAMPKPAEININDNIYQLMFGKQQRTLPFALHLKDFQKTKHPGTMTASAYQSDILLIDGELSWPVRIEMNKPLRYKGYTFFQSSFAEGDHGQATVLSVVKNKGWLFPYFGTALIAFGLLLHTLIQSRRSKTI